MVVFIIFQQSCPVSEGDDGHAEPPGEPEPQHVPRHPKQSQGLA